MEKKYLLFMLLPFLFVSCMTQNKNPDHQVDARLGVEAQDDDQDAESTVQKLQQTQYQEQRRQLERQVSDPLAG